MLHKIKTWPQFFDAVADGTKTFELRENDRGYQKGDEVILQEWDPELDEKRFGKSPAPKGYTGREIKAKIGYVLPVGNNHVAFSLLTTKAGT